ACLPGIRVTTLPNYSASEAFGGRKNKGCAASHHVNPDCAPWVRCATVAVGALALGLRDGPIRLPRQRDLFLRSAGWSRGAAVRGSAASFRTGNAAGHCPRPCAAALASTRRPCAMLPWPPPSA